MTTDGEELVAGEGETPHITTMPFQGSHVLVGVCIPYTDGAIMTTAGEELVAGEGETPHITAMPFQGSHVLVGVCIPYTDGATSGGVVDCPMISILYIYYFK